MGVESGSPACGALVLHLCRLPGLFEFLVVLTPLDSRAHSRASQKPLRELRVRRPRHPVPLGLVLSKGIGLDRVSAKGLEGCDAHIAHTNLRAVVATQCVGAHTESVHVRLLKEVGKHGRSHLSGLAAGGHGTLPMSRSRRSLLQFQVPSQNTNTTTVFEWVSKAPCGTWEAFLRWRFSRRLLTFS